MAAVALQFLLIGMPFIFNDRIDYGFPNTTLGISVFLVGLLGTPIWSIPVAWWSHLRWRATVMQSAPTRGSTTISDVLTRWTLAMIILAAATIAFAVFVWFCMGATANMF